MYEISSYLIYRVAGIDALLQDLKELWKTFIQAISGNIHDYLSLDHLGIILRHLSKKGKYNCFLSVSIILRFVLVCVESFSEYE